MERHLRKDPTRPKQKADSEAGKPLDAADLALVAGEMSTVLTGQDDKPGNEKRFWGVYSGEVARKKTAEAEPGKSKKKKSDPKGIVRPAADKARRGTERPLS